MRSWVCTVFLLLAASAAGQAVKARSTSTGQAELMAAGRIDQAVLRRLKEVGIQPAEPCSDAVFVRRVHLDVIGTLPTAAEARQFLADKAADRRRTLIDRLLERPEFADYQAMKWSDLLRVKSEFPINLWPNAAQAYHEWIRTSIRQNKPYDQFVRELLTSSGSNFRVPAVNFYRALQSRNPEDMAQAVALAFMGVRANKWPKERLAQMAIFFSRLRFKQTAEWKEEIVYCDAVPDAKGPAPEAVTAVLPDGSKMLLPGGRDWRASFADWLIQPANAWFARNIVNRVWYWLLGRGIVHEPDDMRPDNPPRHAELLRLLQDELVKGRYDLKHLFRVILNSKTYQRSSFTATHHPASSADFAAYGLRRLEAEVLIDALCQVTGTTESYSSAIPEPFTFIPESQRSITLPDGSIGSPFLELFGRPPRDTGLESERSNRSTAAQRLHLLNSSHVLQKIERGSLLRNSSRAGRGKAQSVIETVYLTILSRFPTPDELDILRANALKNRALGREALVDLVWALINTAEFQYRH